jgi:hypothetical protein
MYPWPTGDFGSARDVALDTAMNYLDTLGRLRTLLTSSAWGDCDFSGLGRGWRSTGVHCQPRKMRRAESWRRYSATATVGRHTLKAVAGRERQDPTPARALNQPSLPL